MKKTLIIITLIALGVIVYFICGKKEEKAAPEKALISEEVSGYGAGTQGRAREIGTLEDEESYASDDESDTGAKKADAVPAQDNTAVFRIQGESVVNTYSSVANFTKISASPEFTGYLVNFAANIGDVKVSNQETYRHVLSMMLPSEVTPGTYTEKSTPFIVQLFGSESGVLYTLDYNHPFSLTIDEWGGPGGRARGTFSGELKSAEGTNVMQIRDGSFNVGIQ